MDYAKHTDKRGRVKDVDEFIADDDAQRRATALYTERKRDMAAVLDWIGLEVDKHGEHARKEGITFGHAGDLGHLRELLVEALSFLAQRDVKDIEANLADAAIGRRQKRS